MKRLKNISLGTVNHVISCFLLNNEHNCQIMDIVKKVDKLSALVMVLQIKIGEERDKKHDNNARKILPRLFIHKRHVILNKSA